MDDRPDVIMSKALSRAIGRIMSSSAIPKPKSPSSVAELGLSWKKTAVSLWRSVAADKGEHGPRHTSSTKLVNALGERRCYSRKAAEDLEKKGEVRKSTGRGRRARMALRWSPPVPLPRVTYALRAATS